MIQCTCISWLMIPPITLYFLNLQLTSYMIYLTGTILTKTLPFSWNHWTVAPIIHCALSALSSPPNAFWTTSCKIPKKTIDFRKGAREYCIFGNRDWHQRSPIIIWLSEFLWKYITGLQSRDYQYGMKDVVSWMTV